MFTCWLARFGRRGDLNISALRWIYAQVQAEEALRASERDLRLAVVASGLVSDMAPNGDAELVTNES